MTTGPLTSRTSRYATSPCRTAHAMYWKIPWSRPRVVQDARTVASQTKKSAGTAMKSAGATRARAPRRPGAAELFAWSIVAPSCTAALGAFNGSGADDESCIFPRLHEQTPKLAPLPGSRCKHPACHGRARSHAELLDCRFG